MDAIRRLHQPDAEAGLLASGGVRVHQDARGGIGSRGSGLVLAEHAGRSARVAGEAGAGLQASRRVAVCALSPRDPDSLSPLLVILGRAGIELALHPTDPARLRHRRPTPDGWAADLPPDLSARVRLHHGAILGLLASGYAPDAHASDGPDAAYVYAERLGIADGLRMPTHPGSAAWLVAVGETMGSNPAIAPAIERPESIAERWAAVASAALGAPVRASVIAPGERFHGEPDWSDPWARRKPVAVGCHSTTSVVCSGHGETCGRDPKGSRDERQDPLSNCQGIGRIGGATVAAGER